MPRLLALAFLVLAAPHATAQNCSDALSRAETSYSAGDFDATIERLTTCLDADLFSAEERRQAYRLIGLSYIGKDREADARIAVASLLEVAPNYEPNPALDPPPFVRLVSEIRRERPRSAPPGMGRALSTSSGFSGALRAQGASYSDSDSDSYSGGGADLTLGYAISPSLTVYGQLGGFGGDGEGSSISQGEVGIGGRFHVGGGRARLVPFLGAQATYQTATFELNGFGSVDYTGSGGAVEGGLLYFLTPSFAINGGVTAAFSSLSTEGRPDDISATTVRIGVGLFWQP